MKCGSAGPPGVPPTHPHLEDEPGPVLLSFVRSLYCSTYMIHSRRLLLVRSAPLPGRSTDDVSASSFSTSVFLVLLTVRIPVSASVRAHLLVGVTSLRLPTTPNPFDMIADRRLEKD